MKVKHDNEASIIEISENLCKIAGLKLVSAKFGMYIKIGYRKRAGLYEFVNRQSH